MKRRASYTFELGCLLYEKFLHGSSKLMEFAERLNDPKHFEFRVVWMAPLMTTVIASSALPTILFGSPFFVRVAGCVLLLYVACMAALVKLWSERYFSAKNKLDALVSSLDRNDETV